MDSPEIVAVRKIITALEVALAVLRGVGGGYGPEELRLATSTLQTMLDEALARL